MFIDRARYTNGSPRDCIDRFLRLTHLWDVSEAATTDAMNFVCDDATVLEIAKSGKSMVFLTTVAQVLLHENYHSWFYGQCFLYHMEEYAKLHWLNDYSYFYDHVGTSGCFEAELSELVPGDTMARTAHLVERNYRIMCARKFLCDLASKSMLAPGTKLPKKCPFELRDHELRLKC